MADPLATVPRLDVLLGATPLHRWDRFAARLPGRAQVWAKRDDLTPVLLGGNKLRKLEFLVAAAVAEGADVVVTYGAVQSNHCAQTAAVAVGVGLRPVLCLRGPADAPVEGNLLLDRMLGADVRFEPGPHDAAARARWLAEVAEELRAAGRRPAVIPYGGPSPTGAVAFALAGRELQGQLDAAGVEPDVVVVTSSSGGTQAGLVLARAAGDLRVPVVGVSVDPPASELAATVLELAVRTATGYGLASPDGSLVRVVDGFQGPGYGVASAEGRAASELLLRTEGVLTDPVYTAKGLAGLCTLLAERSRPVTAVFWHTGGLPAVFTRRA